MKLGAAAIHHHHEKNENIRDREAGLIRGDNLPRDHQQGRAGILRKPETSDHHRGAEIAGAVGAASLGAAAMHHHNKKKDEERTHEADLLRGNSLTRDHEQGRAGILRKPVASGHTPMSPISPIDDNNRFSQQPVLANTAPYQDSRVSQPNAPLNTSNYNNGSSYPVMPMAAAAAGPHHSRPTMATTTSNDDPYAFNKFGGRNSSSRSRSRHNSMGREIAAGGAGAALGAAVASRKSHDGGRRSMESDRGRRNSENVPDLPPKTYIGDKVYGIPYHASEQGNPPDVIEAPYQPNSKGLRDWSTSSATRVPTTTESSTLDDQSLTRPATHEGSSSHPVLEAGAVGAAAGVGAGAIAAHNRDRNSSRSPARPRRRSFHSRVIAHRPDSEPSSSSSGVSGVPQPLVGNETQSMAIEPFHSEDLPPTPPTRSRRNSALGTGAPAAAAGSYLNQDLPTREVEAERPMTQGSVVPPLPSEMTAAGVFPVSVDRRGNGRMNPAIAAQQPQQQRRPVGNTRPDIPPAMQSGSNGSPWIPPQQQQQRSRTSSFTQPRNSFPSQGHPQAPPPLFATFQSRSSTPPRLPSRSPRRARFSDPQFPLGLNTNSRTDSDTTTTTTSSHGSFTQIPIHHQSQQRVRPSSFDIPGSSSHPPSAYSTRRSSSSHRGSSVPRNVDLSDSFDPASGMGPDGFGGIVGDNRYPHHNLRSRRNTSDFDEVVPVRERRPGDNDRTSDEEQFLTGSSGREGSSDSASRISAGMPGGWIGGDARRRSMSGGRVRLADLRREEEERTGYGQEYHGVGQAL